VIVKYRVPVGLPMGGKKYPSRIRLDSDRVRVSPTGKKLSPYLYSSDQIPSGYQVPVPKLPYLTMVLLNNSQLKMISTSVIFFLQSHLATLHYHRVPIGAILHVARALLPFWIHLLYQFCAILLDDFNGWLYCFRTALVTAMP
jgi:hypothetical protein